MPKKEDAKKTNKGKGAGSRPCSPDRELVNGVGSGRPKAIVGRKRKANAMDKAPDEVHGLIFTLLSEISILQINLWWFGKVQAPSLLPPALSSGSGILGIKQPMCTPN